MAENVSPIPPFRGYSDLEFQLSAKTAHLWGGRTQITSEFQSRRLRRLVNSP
jgi:hypothetical protein